MAATVHSIIATGTQGTIVDIQCQLSNNLPNIVIVGFANKAVGEARERIRGAFATSHIMLPRKRITVNLAPADIPKADSGFDLAIAVAIWRASDQLTTGVDAEQAFIGELGLDGSTRAVRGIIGKLLIGRAKGITSFFIPADNLQQAQLVPDITLVPVASLAQLYGHLALGVPITLARTGSGRYQPGSAASVNSPGPGGIALSEVIGQERAKRALQIAAAGGHNVFFSGPPGTGKSMLARSMATLLPPLTREEMLEVTHLHSLASNDYEQLVSDRPFRAPHHSASHSAIVGGGARSLPGEISLAHRGVLFFDELPEFSRETLEALRQPLEDRVISVARSRSSAAYPANFILVATANPCPCGYYGSPACRCLPYEVIKYRNRLSGPILDRIDLYSDVRGVEHDKLLTRKADPKTDVEARQTIARARRRQAKRFGSPSKLNADMTNAEIKQLARLEPAARTALNRGARRYDISARAYMRTVKVARTIADLEASEAVTVAHINEALAYRAPSLKVAA